MSKKKKRAPKKLKPGSLRERVKRGDLSARDVLTWLGGQQYQNERFKRWLSARKDENRE